MKHCIDYEIMDLYGHHIIYDWCHISYENGIFGLWQLHSIVLLVWVIIQRYVLLQHFIESVIFTQIRPLVRMHIKKHDIGYLIQKR